MRVLPGSLHGVGDGTTLLPLTFNGVTAQTVPAGQHSLRIEAMCVSGIEHGSGVQQCSGGSVVVLGSDICDRGASEAGGRN